MSIRKMALLAAISALGLLAIGSASASATTIRLDPLNTIAPAGSQIMNGGSGSATLTTDLVGNPKIHCANTAFSADIGASGATNVTGKLTTLTFTSCTDNLPVINISSCHLHNSGIPTLSIMAGTGGASTTALNDPLVYCGVVASTSGCYYTAAQANGTGSNTGSTLNFPNVAVTHTAAGTTNDLGALCGGFATFTVALSDLTVRDPSGSSTTVTVL
jgi:hypothetical protein